MGYATDALRDPSLDGLERIHAFNEAIKNETREEEVLDLLDPGRVWLWTIPDHVLTDLHCKSEAVTRLAAIAYNSPDEWVRALVDEGVVRVKDFFKIIEPSSYWPTHQLTLAKIMQSSGELFFAKFATTAETQEIAVRLSMDSMQAYDWLYHVEPVDPDALKIIVQHYGEDHEANAEVISDWLELPSYDAEDWMGRVSGYAYSPMTPRRMDYFKKWLGGMPDNLATHHIIYSLIDNPTITGEDRVELYRHSPFYLSSRDLKSSDCLTYLEMLLERESWKNASNLTAAHYYSYLGYVPSERQDLFKMAVRGPQELQLAAVKTSTCATETLLDASVELAFSEPSRKAEIRAIMKETLGPSEYENALGLSGEFAGSVREMMTAAQLV